MAIGALFEIWAVSCLAHRFTTQGCPINLSENHDDPSIGDDVELNNNFNYDNGTDLTKCPITAHTRKMAPRAIPGFPPEHLEERLIMRGSIPYGGEVRLTS